MAMIPPPEGISEADYETIEAAVMETVRGRWFLAEFARRGRVDEMRQMLDALARLEQTVREQHALPADPSIRLLVQRLKDVSQNLDRMVTDMRLRGLDEKFCAGIEAQARAVSGLLRLNQPPALPAAEQAPPRRAPIVSAPATPKATAEAPPNPQATHDARLAALERLDKLPIAEKLSLFT
jgi:hypothetical protein